MEFLNFYEGLVIFRTDILSTMSAVLCLSIKGFRFKILSVFFYIYIIYHILESTFQVCLIKQTTGGHLPKKAIGGSLLKFNVIAY